MAKKKTALAAALNKKKNKPKAVQNKQKTQQKPKEKSRVASDKKTVEKGQQKSTVGTKTGTEQKKVEPKPPTTQRGAVVLSGRTTARRNAAKNIGDSFKKAINLQKEEKYKSKETDKYRAAIDTAQHTSALGTNIKEVKETYELSDKEKRKNSIRRSVEKAKIRVAYVKQGEEIKAELIKQGYDPVAVGKAVDAEVEKGIKQAQKQIEKNNKDKIEYSYKQLSHQDYGKQVVAAMTGQYRNLMKTDKDLNKKVANLNVKDYAKSPLVMGALDQLTQGLSVSEDPIFNYSKGQNKIMDLQKQTGKYNAGRAIGAVAEFGTSGVGTVGSSIFKLAGKEALEAAAKQGGKQLVKTVGKNIAKETAGDTVASAGLNALDALKFSYKDGEFDKKTFAKELALNVAGDVLIGGAVSGITHGLSAKQVANFNKINKKIKKGETLSLTEQKFYNKHLDDFTKEVEAKIERETEQQATKPSDAVDNTVDNTARAGSSGSQMGEIVRESARRVGRDVDNDNVVKLAEKISGDTNTRIEFATNDELVKMYGKTNIGGVVTEDGRMLINSDSDRALQTIIGHETSHILESTTQYNELKQLVKEYAESLGEYGSLVDEFTDLYKGTNANIEDEVTAELIGKYLFTDDNFIRNLSATQPNTFQKIYQRIKDLLATVTKGSAEEKQLLAVQRKFEDAYREAQGVSKTSDRSRNMFIGEGKNLKYTGYSNLQKAKEMAEEADADMNYIRKKTGWYKDGDDWKFEISDRGAKVNAEKLAENGEYTLSDLLDHPKLYEAYPELKENKVEIYNNPAKKEYGEVTDDGVIRINMAYNDESEALKTLLHEAQHKIQTAENWYEGGDPDHFILKDGQSEYTKLLDSKRGEAIKNGDLQTAALYDSMKKDYLEEWEVGKSNGMTDEDLANSFYERLSGEAEARDVENRKILTDLSRRRTKPTTVVRDDLIQLKNQGRGIRDVRGKENSIGERSSVAGNRLYGNGAGRNKKASTVNAKTDRLVGRAPSNQDIQTTTLRAQDESFFNTQNNPRFSLSKETKAPSLKTQVDEMRKAGRTDGEILEELEKQGVDKYDAMQAVDGDVDVKFKEEIKKANNNVSFEDYMKDEIKLVELKKEYSELKYKVQNTENPEHYKQYVQRRTEIADILDEIAERRKVENIAIPQKKTVTDAEDLTGAARGAYKEDLQTLTRGSRRGLDNLYRIFVDTFHGFEQYAKELPKEARETFRAQINAARNAKNKAGGWLSEARIDASGKKVGSSFNDIMGDMLNPKNAKKYEEFQYYLANKHNIDRYPEGKGVFGDEITDTDSRAICEKLESEYEDFADIQGELSKYFKDLQQYRVDTGLVSKSTAEYLDALYPNYVPTYRVVDGQRVRIADKPNTTIEMGDIIKEAKGSNAEMLPLHEQVANLTEYTMKMGEQNRIFNLIATTQGVNVKKIDPSVRLDDLVDACTFTNKTTDGATNKFYVAFYENGAPRKIEISEQMYLGIREWRNDPDSLASMLNWKAKHIRGANALFKNLITGWNPIFGVKNIIKDTGEALLYTKNAKGFIKSYPKAIAAIVNKKSDYAKYFDLYQASGGKYAHIREDISTFKTDSTFKKIAKAPLEVCQRFNDCLEAIPRMAEFISTIDNSLDAKKMLKAGKSIDDVLKKMDTDTINRALYNANEVTLNFGRSGVAGKALNSTIIPYLNPAIQGLDKLRRVFVDAGTDGIKGWLGLAGKIGAFAVAPAMFNEVMMTFFGGEAYQILNTRDKDNNYFIPIGDGKFIKIPKARVSSALASPFEHFYRHAMYGDPMEWKQMFSTAWSNVGVMNPVESSLFSPIGLVLANKTWYGGSIENASDLDLRATGERSKIYDETTSAIAIWIGDKLNWSPKKIDYIIDAYTGCIGDILLPMTAEASSGNPLYKNFILDSVFSNKLSTSFWDKNANLEAYSNAKGGEYSEKYEEWKAEYMYDALIINQAIHDIDSDKNLTRKQKLEMKRELRKGLNKYYAAGTNGTKINLEPVSFIAKQIGADKALRKYLPDSENKKYSFKEHYASFKALEGYANGSKADKNKIANQFLKTYKLAVETQKQIDVKYHNTPDWTTIAISNVMTKSSDNISIACGVYKDTLDEAKTYVKYNGDTKKYITTQKRINKIVDKIEKQGTDVSNNIYKKYLKSGVSALALASSSISFKDRAYYITGTDGKMNASRGLMSKYDWKIADVVNLGFSADSDGNTYLKKQEVVDAIENSKAKTTEEKAMLFNIIYGDSGSNPYGSIGNYSVSGDTGITKTRSTSSGGGGGYRRSGGGSSKRSSVPSWENYVKDHITSAEKSSGVNFKDWDSSLDKSYQNKTKAIRKKMEV